MNHKKVIFLKKCVRVVNAHLTGARNKKILR